MPVWNCPRNVGNFKSGRCQGGRRLVFDRGYLAADASANPLDLAEPVGATYCFGVVGTSQGPLWGPDLYTDDFGNPDGAVHTGLVKPGESAAVRANRRGDTRADKIARTERMGYTQ